MKLGLSADDGCSRDLYDVLTSMCQNDGQVHAILGVRARPNLVRGRPDSQDRMDQGAMIARQGEETVKSTSLAL